MTTELVLVDLDLGGNNLVRAALEPLATAPTTPLPRQMYYDTVIDSPRIRNSANTAWITLDATKLSGVIPIGALTVDPLARANHTGTQLASTISNFDTQVRTSRLDQMSQPTAAVSMNGQNLTNLLDPVNNLDAANKQWVMSQVQASAAGIDSKPSCRFTTVGDITLSGLGTQAGGDWGVALTSGDRVLVKDQADGTQNGAYIASSGSWSRASDSINTGALYVIEEGATLNTTVWMLATPNPITIGTTSLTFNKFSIGTAYTAGNGVTITGNAINVNPLAGGGIISNGAGVSVDTTVGRTAVATITGDNVNQVFSITHNLNKKGFPVFVTQAQAPYALVRPGIQYDTMNTIKVYFNSPVPTGTNYTVDWVG